MTKLKVIIKYLQKNNLVLPLFALIVSVFPQLLVQALASSGSDYLPVLSILSYILFVFGVGSLCLYLIKYAFGNKAVESESVEKATVQTIRTRFFLSVIPIVFGMVITIIIIELIIK